MAWRTPSRSSASAATCSATTSTPSSGERETCQLFVYFYQLFVYVFSSGEFQNLRRLRELDLSYNKLTEIEDGLLEGCVNLKVRKEQMASLSTSTGMA